MGLCMIENSNIRVNKISRETVILELITLGYETDKIHVSDMQEKTFAVTESTEV